MEASTARDEINTLLDDTFGAITPALKWRDTTFTLKPKQTADNKDRDVAIANKDRQVLTRLSKEKVGSLLGLVERHWKQRGYEVESVNPKDPSIQVRTSKGYELRLVVGGEENIATFSSSVGDVKYHGEPYPFGPGDPAPTNSAGQPDYGLTYDDPFWSH
ncbi:hypothetical protein [Kitasatospora sp. NPDC050543]|uniref:hypothetical protein n=1 Tax=Kitasatospora sp. NPDC050543 TaxID=3364054 RepID=UPI0037997D8B